MYTIIILSWEVYPSSYLDSHTFHEIKNLNFTVCIHPITALTAQVNNYTNFSVAASITAESNPKSIY
jgi:hypothetical protein